MMKSITKIILFVFAGCLTFCSANAQLVIKSESNAQALIQKLLGQGVTVSNVTFKGNDVMAGSFVNLGNNKISLDSGIVLTNGRAKSDRTISATGVDGDGFIAAGDILADNSWGLPGDDDLADEIGNPHDDLHDACVLEFDFVPLGDSIKFRYVFSSEEYTPAFVCSFNDAFAFFISKVGVPGSQQNIALIPGTSTPVSIFNVNDVPGGACPNNATYYIDNVANTFFTHDGHTQVLTALARVSPCEKYHLKLVISDVGDDQYDSGVFLEAKSLSSNAISMTNLTQTDPGGDSYLVEGCATGSFKIRRPEPQPSPLNVTLSYGGTFSNGVDVQPLPLFVTIPANQTEVTVDVLPMIDNMPEGIETIKIYAIAGCASGLPTDSATIQLRDYDILGISPDTTFLCKHDGIQLTASGGYSVYTWDANTTLSNTGIRNPVATPTSSETMYYCTGTEGTCNARDSAFVKWKELDLIAATGINCKNDATGTITVDGGYEWIDGPMYSINNGAYQTSGAFTGLPVGLYRLKIKDNPGCIDSLDIAVTQLFPDLLISGIPVTAATCSGAPDGTATITMTGGKNPYSYSLDGVNFQSGNVFNLVTGNYTVTIKDMNGCSATQNIFIPFNNDVTVEAGADPTICESKSTQLNAVANATSISWWPTTALNDPGVPDPVASPVITTKYYATATTGICTKIDSVTVIVNLAPIPDAGLDSTICFGQDIRLAASGGVQYFWKPSSYLSSTSVYNPVVQRLPGSFKYYLSVIDANGCASLKKDSIMITVTRPAEVDAGKDTVFVAINQPWSLKAVDVNRSGFTSYLWSPAYGLNRSDIPDPVATLDKDMLYKITARTRNGCEATDKILVKVYRGPEIYVPNAFTPNNDSRNDVLRAIPIGMKEFHYFRIYNRWGQPIFSTADPAVGWNGKVDAREQGTATFIWIAEAVDYKGNIIQRKGTVTVVR
jgi:gliding motility-associated-like protein